MQFCSCKLIAPHMRTAGRGSQQDVPTSLQGAAPRKDSRAGLGAPGTSGTGLCHRRAVLTLIPMGLDAMLATVWSFDGKCCLNVRNLFAYDRRSDCGSGAGKLRHALGCRPIASVGPDGRRHDHPNSVDRPIKTGSTGWLTSMAFSPDNTELYVCSYKVTLIFPSQKHRNRPVPNAATCCSPRNRQYLAPPVWSTGMSAALL